MKAKSFAELGDVRRLLQERQREAERREAERRAEEERLRRERELFTRSVGRIHALKERGLAEVPRERPEPVPFQRRLDEQEVLREAISDEFDVETLLETDAALSFRRPGVGPEVVRRLRRGEWVIQAQIDLHGLRREEAREQLAEFLREAVRHGLRCVRVIHGKGNGSPGREPVLKTKVRGWLVQKEEVIAYVQARASDGGNGALVVLLRPSNDLARRPASASAP
ncbi:Smr/MutS family protein [Caldimonas brevitalea]|uniref:DNA mismatch repair protein MutS n=1 Tax=Caldimonas brevitalea TaxID=413882 RepID=A0A0G3BNB8_9BURK|nr:Smr/MutS family protein [Caldimonas brevitalea]AKJ28045.1 DNA mismatch repair protein MutS [Caldimonas brevitalea]